MDAIKVQYPVSITQNRFSNDGYKYYCDIIIVVHSNNGSNYDKTKTLHEEKYWWDFQLQW